MFSFEIHVTFLIYLPHKIECMYININKVFCITHYVKYDTYILKVTLNANEYI